jgi:hypothetical protein
MIMPEPRPQTERREFLHPTTGNRITASVVRRANDPVVQRSTMLWRFAEEGSDGSLLREEFEELTMRWTYRYEMRHLLERCGFEILSEFSDFAGTQPAYGGEQVWVARRPAAGR